ncbi:MAG: hypothetical protein ACRYFS_13060 [Janthinobacterium lividum]
MQIEYTLAQSEKQKLRDDLRTPNPRVSNRTTLLYQYTKGVVRLSCGGESLELYIPVLDFAWSLLHIISRLQTDDQAIFEFTESEDRISFHRSAVINITSDYLDWSCQCTYEQLQASVVTFAQTVLDDLCTSIPEIAKHSLIEEAYAKLEGIK